MKRNVSEEYVLITDHRVTELIAKIVKQTNPYQRDNAPNLADYSTEFANVK